jgi:hypothetical protein
MRKAFILAPAVAIVCLYGGRISAQEMSDYYSECRVRDGVGYNACGSSRPGCAQPYKKRMVHAGCYNCECQGSYKFPVPPQYTYHWPGMYSQQTMTEYYSPWRFPPLNLPKNELVDPEVDAPEAPSTSTAIAPEEPASEQESVSEKIKRRYGTE